MVTLIPGCSYIAVHGPPPKQEWSEPDKHRNTNCTDSGVLPGLDFTMGLVSLIVVGTISSMATSGFMRDDKPEIGATDIIAISSGFALSLTPLTSGIFGFHQVHQCREFKEHRLKMHRRTDEKPKPTPSPPSQTP